MRPLTHAELKKLSFVVVDENRQVKGDNQDFFFLWNVAIQNDTNVELAEIDLQMTLERDGKTVYKGPIKRVREFSNYNFPDIHTSLLPQEFSNYLPDMVTEAPASALVHTVFPALHIVDAYAFTGNQDLHDLNHLHMRLLKSSDQEAIGLFKRDPALLNLQSGRYSTLDIAYATSGIKTIEYVLANMRREVVQPKFRKLFDPVAMKAAPVAISAINPKPGVLDWAIKRWGGDLKKWNRNYASPMANSIAHLSRQNLQILLKRGMDPNAADQNGMTMTHWAIYMERPEFLADLVKAGAKINGRDNLGNGWMEFCVHNPVMIDTALKYGISIDDENPVSGKTPLYSAVSRSMSGSVIAFLKRGANPYAKKLYAMDTFALADTMGSAWGSAYRKLVKLYWKRKK